MSGSQIFVCIFAAVSVAVSGMAIWLVAKTPEVKYRPLWILGSLLGFVGFATDLRADTDLYLQFGIQIPVLMLWKTIGSDHVILKVLFPVVGAAALVKFHSRSPGPGG